MEDMYPCPSAKCVRGIIEPPLYTMNVMIEPQKPGVAEIVFDHVVIDGKCMLQIAEINGVLGYHDLPDEYKTTRPMMYRSVRHLWVHTDGIGYRYTICQTLLESEATELVKRMRACGKRLHDINVAARAKADEERLERWKAKGRKVVRI